MKKTLKTLVLVLLVLLLILGAAGFFAARFYLNKVERIDSEQLEVVQPEDEDFETDAPLADTSEEEPLPSVWNGDPDLPDEDLINILLVGQDTRGSKRARSDSMILCSLNPDTKQVSLISFLRDTYVDLPGEYSDNRLNAAYAFGGFPMLYETLEMNFGLSIDGGIEVDFKGFEQIVDCLGGVDIQLTGAEAEQLHLSAGMNHLNGEQALTYSRIRYIDSDFGRTERQRNVLTALFNKFKNSDFGTVMDLVNQLLGMVRTDMSNSEIIRLATKVAPMLSQLELSTYHVPGDGAYQFANRRGMSVLIPDMASIHSSLLNEYLPLGA